MKPQFDEATMGYVQYAAHIESRRVEKYLAGLARRFKALQSKRRLCRGTTLESWAKTEIWLTIDRFEREQRLPSSYTDSDRPAAAHRCWERMLTNCETARRLAIGRIVEKHRQRVLAAAA